ncbi:MAG: hypothetical protein LUE13_10800 [Akkermansiaceae bacterium]|nr:hypothetical protein [Akkermansiaceae bacterium]
MNQGGKPETNTLLGFFTIWLLNHPEKKETEHAVLPLTPLFQDQNDPSGNIISGKKQPFFSGIQPHLS